ncbi:arogenate dehydrogenase 1, chloroplastic [Ricinus communis]|uniref:Prephenate dehydrogenase, putative n=1 Tax=Ricinus communis TaxID=3988 RepID=B9SXN5_RICCO|nr:arogenate dehydrogenase 1, chloroplastic [Ricinus communis]EEF31614.1 prephenate dehydrogenase, putative [Ricinus communis]|eukprot:XP_002530754.1 arogenate dehydrogenase 1, chloroplastic [Ricinus communis]
MLSIKPSFRSLSLLSPPPPPQPPPSLFPTSKPTTISIRTHLFIKSQSATATKKQLIPKTNPDNTTQRPPLSNSHVLKVAIIGFGNFGQFLAKTLVAQGHTVLAHSRTDHSLEAHSLGVSFFLDPHDLCEQHPDVILLCTSIISTEKVLKSLPLQRFKRNTLFVDVLSVKEFAKNLLLDLLPSDFDIICSHPMFGPQSAKLGWDGLHFVYEKVRIGNEESRVTRCKSFLDVFAREGCKMVELSCHEHDKYAAGSQFITHTVGRVLEMLSLESTPINTKGYESLLGLVENTAEDSFDLYYGLFMYNKNALEMLERLDLAFEALRKQLFGRLHDVVRKQLFGNEERGQFSQVDHANMHTYGAAFLSAPEAERFQGAAQPYEYKAKTSNCINDNSKLKIAIVGFGNFGQFLAKTLVRQGHTVLAYSRSDYSDEAQKLGVSYFSDANDLCEEHPEVILLCTSILSTENVLKSLPVQRLKRSTLFVDVLSVKEFPRNLFLQHLPPDFDILCTHPMFGPESGKNGWNHLPFLFDKVRVGSDERRVSRCDRFLDIFAREGCRMVEMSCSEHDWHAAGSQFITHTMGRILEKLGLESTPINTKGYETLLNLVENTAGDSFDLYYGLFMYNVNAMEQLERLDLAFESLKKQLFGRLHGVLRKQLFENEEKSQVLREESLVSKVSQDDAALAYVLDSVQNN